MPLSLLLLYLESERDLAKYRRYLTVAPRFSEYRARDESTWDDGGPLSRLGAHDAGRHEDLEGAGDFQS